MGGEQVQPSGFHLPQVAAIGQRFPPPDGVGNMAPPAGTRRQSPGQAEGQIGVRSRHQEAGPTEPAQYCVQARVAHCERLRPPGAVG